MARRETFTASILEAEIGLKLPIYKQANKAMLKTLLTSKILDFDSTDNTVDLALRTRMGERESGKICLAEITGDHIIGVDDLAALTDQDAEGNDRFINDIDDPRYYAEGWRITAADDVDTAENQDDIGLYIISFNFRSYAMANSSKVGEFQYIKFTDEAI